MKHFLMGQILFIHFTHFLQLIYLSLYYGTKYNAEHVGLYYMMSNTIIFIIIIDGVGMLS